MGFFKKILDARQKRVETRNNRKIEVAKAKYSAQAVGYENGVDPSVGAKVGPIVQTGLGMIKSFFGGNDTSMPLPESSGMDSKTVMLAGGGLIAAVVVGALILKKK